MTETMTEFDWDAVEATAVEKLREPKVQPVPAAIIRQAQRAVTGETQPDGEVRHTFEYRFPTVEAAVAFAKHIKNAGRHTDPVSTITPLVDPEGVAKGYAVDPTLVRWQAGERRGKRAKPASGQESA